MRIPRADKRFFHLAGRHLAPLSRRLPPGLLGDRLFSLLHFLKWHGRLPKRRNGTFLDHLYQMKRSGALLSLPRQMVSDKEYAKLFINDVLGGEYAVQTLRVLRSPDEVRDEIFPADCAIKPTHASQACIIRRNDAPLDLDTIRSFFDCDLYRAGREQNYRFLERKVIVEPIVFGGADFVEVNVQCYNGQARLLSVKSEGGDARERRDRDWGEIDIPSRRPKPKTPVPKPEVWDEILWAVETLAARFDYIRVDIYTTGKDFLIGELTNCHTNAAMRFLRAGDEQEFTRHLFGDRIDQT